MKPSDLSTTASIHLPPAGRTAMLLALGVSGAGLAAAAAGYFMVPPDRFFRAYLTAFMLVLSIALGGLIFTLIQHASRAGWSASVRRLFELLAWNLTWLWVLFIPVAVAMYMSDRTGLYEWNVTAVMEHDEILQGKEAYLNPTFWLVRAAVFFTIWGFFGWFCLSTSVRQDETGDVGLTHRLQRLAPVGILLFAVTITLATVDWVMSLEPHWFSTIIGVYFFAASSAAFLSTVILLVYFLQRAGCLRREITLEHYQDLGKLLFAFGVVFWAYIAFSQFMLIWYANLPEETPWFLIRSLDGWWGLSLVLLLGHFLVPFLFLLSRHPKRVRPVIACAAGWMLVMAFVDFYWLVMPQVPMDLLTAMVHDRTLDFQHFVQAFHEEIVPAEVLTHKGMDPALELTYAEVYGFRPHLVDIACVLGLGGLFVAVTLRRASTCALVARQDPRLPEALAFENM